MHKIFWQNFIVSIFCMGTLFADAPPIDPHDFLETIFLHNESYAEPLLPLRIVSDETFIELMLQFKTDALSYQEARSRIIALTKEHPEIDFIIRQLTDIDLYRRAKFPSRLLFVGPSGTGKTTAAKALAEYCGMRCVFVKGSSVGNTYQNSGSTLITTLFQGMFERPEQKFLVIIDEFTALTRFSTDGKDLQQNKTAMAFWQALDECEHKRHICVVGTDNEDPETLADQLKTRFKHNIYVFKHAQKQDIVRIIKETLACESDFRYMDGDYQEQMSDVSDSFLERLATLVQHLSIREIQDLVEKAKVLAITELRDPDAQVKEEHVQRVFEAYQDPCWWKKLWRDRHKHVRIIKSWRAISLYMTISGMMLRIYSEEYKHHGTMLAGLGFVLNNYLPREEKETNDIPLFGALTQLFGQTESQQQFRVSYEQNQKQQEYAKMCRQEDLERQEVWQEKQEKQHSESYDLARISYEHSKQTAEKQLALSEENNKHTNAARELQLHILDHTLATEKSARFGSISAGKSGVQYSNSPDKVADLLVGACEGIGDSLGMTNDKVCTENNIRSEQYVVEVAMESKKIDCIAGQSMTANTPEMHIENAASINSGILDLMRNKLHRIKTGLSSCLNWCVEKVAPARVTRTKLERYIRSELQLSENQKSTVVPKSRICG